MICNISHLFGGGLSGHVQSTVAHGGGSRSEGGGRADEEGGNSELHVDSLFACRKVSRMSSRDERSTDAMEQHHRLTYRMAGEKFG